MHLLTHSAIRQKTGLSITDPQAWEKHPVEFVWSSSVQQALTEPVLDLDRIRMLLHAPRHDGVNLDVCSLESAPRQRLFSCGSRLPRRPLAAPLYLGTTIRTVPNPLQNRQRSPSMSFPEPAHSAHLATI